MAACVLALLVVAPSVSLAACICDDAAPVAIASVEASLTADQAVQNDPQDHGAPCEAACCVGGHCHHGGAMLDALVATISAPMLAASAHVGASAPTLASRTLSGPDRPPRG